MRKFASILAVVFAGQAMADTVFDDFSGDAGARWDYVADRVMGGISSGRAEIIGSGPNLRMRLTGTVSTENNGGFIQVRRRFDDPWRDGAQGLELQARGNGETYYVFLKTPNLSRVWYSYRASFSANESWQTVKLPFTRFAASHERMPQSFDPAQVTSLAIVAYGSDYNADVEVSQISLY